MSAVNTFIKKIEDKVLEGHRVPLIDMALQSTSARWWSNHCNSLLQWDRFATALKAIFKEVEGPQVKDIYQGESDPKNHLKGCEYQWRTERYPKELWVHKFIHSLDLIP